MYVRNEEEFGEAIREGKDGIELEGDLASKVKKLYKINLTLWSFCLVCLAVAIIALMQVPITGGTSGIVSLIAGTPAAAILGTEAAVTAVMIGVAGGGVGVLIKLRQAYRIETRKNGRIIVYLKK
ncbi:hypothetical protein [Lacrimispora celerecrescens]|uniref:hypothetical protein n=1 Tax=Lacrimispora celerecrescens TaxID=29354 RepID=UPI0016466E8E|nr:hypothetical protein [Lacrimispora celerecrescens]